MKNKLINTVDIEFIDIEQQQYILGGNIISKPEPIENILRTIYYPDNTI